MSNHPVDKLLGVGKVTKEHLEKEGVKTIGDLAKIDVNDSKYNGVKNMTTFIQRAKLYIKEREPDEKNEQEEKVIMNGIEVVEEKKEVVKVEEELKDRYVLENHTWWETKVLIPDSKNNDQLSEAIIYDMCFDPYNRISFMCCWVTNNDECMSSMTFSPQMILFFNINMPELKISVSPSEWLKIENRYTIENALWETNVMRQSSIAN